MSGKFRSSSANPICTLCPDRCYKSYFDRSQHFKILVTENLGLSNSFLDISKAKEVAKTRWKKAKDD